MQVRKNHKGNFLTTKNETQSNCNYTENDSQDNQYETSICNAVIEYLKNLIKTKKFLIFHQKLNSLFGNTLLSDEHFLQQFAKKLALQPYRFIANLAKWSGVGLIKQRGRQSLSLDLSTENL